MGSLSGDDYTFFDAADDIASISNDNSSTEYDVWVESPLSVQERRSRFLNWMDVMIDGNPLHRGSHKPEEVNSATSNTLPNHTPSSFPPISIHFTNISDEDNRNGNCAEIRECSSQTTPINNKSESTRSHKRFRNWLRKPRSFPAATRNESSSTQEGQRVKVRLRGKRLKELSALYARQTIQAHRGAILAMKFSPDGQFLASAGEDGVARVWKVIQIDRSQELILPNPEPSCVYFTVNHLSELKPLLTEKKKSSNSKSLKNSNSACVVFPTKVFRIVENPIHEFRGHRAEIVDISWSSNNYLLSASVDKTVRLWKTGCDSCLRVFSHSNYVTCVQFNPVDETHFITGSIDGKIRVWNLLSFQVDDWVDVKDIITAVSYRKDGNGGVIGSMEGNCRFFSVSGNRLQIEGVTSLRSKKKAPCRGITSFQWEDSSKVLVTSADSRIRILNGHELVTKYKAAKSSGNVLSASVTSNKRHIVSASEDSHVYVWSHVEELGLHRRKPSTVRSCERFATDAAIAISWEGFGDTSESPSAFSVDQEYFQEPWHRGATWPDEKLPAAMAMDGSVLKFVKGSCQNAAVSHAWGMVIVTAGFDGRIKSFHNYGLPVSHLKV